MAYLRTLLSGAIALSSLFLQASEGPAGPDQNICGSITSLAADPLASGEQGFWSVVSGSATFASENSPTTLVTGLAIGENLIRWTVLGNGLPESDELYITVFDPALPPANAGADSVLCATNPTLAMQAAPVPAHVLGTWVVTAGDALISSPTDPYAQVTLPNGGMAVLAWVVFNGPCGESQDEVVLSVQPCAVGIDEALARAPRIWFDAAQQAVRIETATSLEGLELRDALGMLVLTRVASSGHSTAVPVPHLVPGVYLVSLRSARGTVVRRFAIDR